MQKSKRKQPNIVSHLFPLPVRQESVLGLWRHRTRHLRKKQPGECPPQQSGRRSHPGPELLTANSSEQVKRSKRTQRRRRRVLVIGDSILRGTEGPICRQDPSTREVYCLPGAKIRDVKEVIQARIKPTDYCPMVLVHVGTNDAARRTPDHLMADYHALGGVLKGFGAQVLFSSILPVNGRGRRHENCIRETNWRLRQWCLEAGFGFLDNDPHITTRDMLTWDGLHLSPKGYKTPGHRRSGGCRILRLQEGLRYGIPLHTGEQGGEDLQCLLKK
ncbi:uncharacterized protein LOC132244080 isoform X2 [Alligator mississippiensis]|uniref:uncharacterized protein LOC132244080 isoform X2 n=1 Tax=Alligator mississippiensis TaxID=8496 RepID=UPI0028778EF0|nr:uncharacterized protein LOC132244080 isoform X2 [Alligator mississippiensis]